MDGDERRSPEHLAAQKAAELAANPRRLLKHLQQLDDRNSRNAERISELEEQVALFKKVATERDRLKKQLASNRSEWADERQRLVDEIDQIVAERRVREAENPSFKLATAELESQKFELLVERARDKTRIEMLDLQVEAFAKDAAQRDDLWERLASRERESANELVELQRRLSAAQGALHTYRMECEQLRDSVKRLRKSRALRLGRAILSPVRAMKRPLSYPALPQQASARVAPVADVTPEDGTERK